MAFTALAAHPGHVGGEHGGVGGLVDRWTGRDGAGRQCQLGGKELG